MRGRERGEREKEERKKGRRWKRRGKGEVEKVEEGEIEGGGR